jgi:hypothetical protein
MICSCLELQWTSLSLLRFFYYLLCHLSMLLLSSSAFLRTNNLIFIYSSSVMTGTTFNAMFLYCLVFVVYLLLRGLY